MGTTISKYTEPVKEYVTGRKRKFSETNDSEAEIELALNTPKRKKLVKTADYIFKTLFLEGKNSDIKVLALGKCFDLHKIYLCQSPYFASMFGGSWLESTKNFIPIEIVDTQITLESLTIVFGSLYRDDIVLEPKGIISVLATATLFQLEGIIEQCVEVMLETINAKTAVKYYQAGCEYGCQKIKDVTFRWLLINLLSYYHDHPKRLKKIPNKLLTELISSPDLFVLQTEFSIYTLLKMWLLTRINPEFAKNPDENGINFFTERKDPTPFLLTEEGKKYTAPFKALRLKNLLLHHVDIETIHTDNIIPQSWLTPKVYEQWYTILKINNNIDKGPMECSDDKFLSECIRCGRILYQRDKHMWRWTGFHYGLDLVVVSDGHSMSIKRNHKQDSEQMLSLQIHRNLLVRATVASLNKQTQVKHIQTTGIKSITLTRNEEIMLLSFDSQLTFPILISLNLLLITPSLDKEVEVKT